MNNLHGDVIAVLNMFPTEKGGRRGPTPNERFGCLMVIGGKSFAVRLDLREVGSILPGQTVRVPIRFLDWDSVKDNCNVGTKFFLREVQTIGEGVVEELNN